MTFVDKHRAGALLALGAASGAIALAYEVLWARELLNLLGSTTRASTIVLAAFMSGLAIGAWVGGRIARRFSEPLWLYVFAEAGLVLFALAFPELAAVIEATAPTWASVTLTSLLVPPAVLMGFTLPALAAGLQIIGATALRFVARLYGLNALGGAAAAFATGFLTLPVLGLRRSELVTVGLGVLAVITAGILAWRYNLSIRSRLFRSGPVSDLPAQVRAPGILIALFLSGTAALGYEVLWTRTLVLVVGSSTNAFTAMLGLYVAGLALGSLLIGRRLDKSRQPSALFLYLQLGIATAALAGAALVILLPSIALAGYAILGSLPGTSAIVGLALASLIIIPPTVLIGASLPVGARLLQGRTPDRGRELGAALACVTAGNVVGVIAAAYWVIPWVGLQRGIAAFVVLNLLAALAVFAGRPETELRRNWLVPGMSLGLLLVFLTLPRWDQAVMTSGVFRHAPTYLEMLGGPRELERAFAAYRTGYYKEGSEAVVAVFDRPTLEGTPHRVLTIDGKVDASTGADMATQVLSGHLPFLFNPNAKRALMIGLASGVTAGALAEHDLRTIDIVEIEPAVVPASRLFDEVSGAPLNDPRVRVIINDGRRFLRATRSRYDIIVSEPSNPWLSMSARLFTREFFEQVRARLSERGVLVQWVPLYALGEEHFAALLRTLLTVFPYANLFQSAEGDLLAIASANPHELSPGALEALYEGTASGGLRDIDLDAPEGLLARWIADAAGLRAILGEGPLNTDDNGLLELGSPWYVLRDTAPSNRTLVERASSESRFIDRIVEILLSRDGGKERLVALAARHGSDGKTALVRNLSTSLRRHGRDALADLLAGDADAAEGRWREARRAWERHEGVEFWRRRAQLAFRDGEISEAIALLERISPATRRPDDEIYYALSLRALGRIEDAVKVLEPVLKSNLSATTVLGSFVLARLQAEIDRQTDSRSTYAWFQSRVNELRRCLERDRCHDLLETLLQWMEISGPAISDNARNELRQELYIRVLRPLPVYFHAVSLAWLGEPGPARQSLKRYLRLLPEPDPGSRAHALMANLAPPA